MVDMKVFLLFALCLAESHCQKDLGLNTAAGAFQENDNVSITVHSVEFGILCGQTFRFQFGP